MKTTLRLLLAGLLSLAYATLSHATHNRAGEIIVRQINGCNSNTVRATIYTYTKTSKPQADRDTLTLCWGDAANTCVQVPRLNGPQPDPSLPPIGEELPNDVKFNIYEAEFTYDGPGRYTISMTDPNRNEFILNVNPPASDAIKFHLQTTFTLFNGQFEGCNSSPILLQPPIDYACKGEPFVHNPNAYDADGDILTYELIVPMQGLDSPAPNYTFPQNIGGFGCCLDINNMTGTITWTTPQVLGEYNIAMIIISWRNGVAIDTTVRDMQILVEDCIGNKAPKIETISEICVIAGEVVEFQVTATDPNPGDQIKLTALGAPFLVDVSPADNEEDWRPSGNPSAVHETQPVTKTFRWQTACEHISDLPYTVVFKAEDDFFIQTNDLTTGLATLKAVRIKVVGPPPTDVQAVPTADQIHVTWAKPYQCEDAADDYFFAFSVWRRIGSNPFPIDECKPGLEGEGYTKILNTLSEQNGRYSFKDNDVERGRTYCYRILGIFTKRTDTGHPYNQVESLPSQEICIQLKLDVPLLTNVSVLQTSGTDGVIEVKWIKPIAEDLDTLLNPGPYRYVLKRARDVGGTDFTTIATYNSPTFWQLSQTQFIDQASGLDTKGHPYAYKIDFFVNNETEPVGNSPSASSVWLQIEPTDNRNILTFRYDVPWSNTSFTIFRQNGAQWDSIGVTDSVYVDKDLINGREYCYYARAEGTYNVVGVPSPLINLSQEACSIPVDNIAPCPPVLVVSNICNTGKSCQEQEKLENQLDWINPMNLNCEDTDDVVSYRVYYKAFETDEFELVGEIGLSGDTTFFHEPERGLAGCYAVTALDTFLNESALSTPICTDNCPTYTLPNAFTPNGDDANEVFIPYPYCFIESIELKVFNRWGELVFTAKDPNINWDGTNLNGKALPSGTYYYTCKVFEQRVTGTVPAPELLRGYIDVIR